MIFDAHCHLNDPRFRQDLDAVLARMRDAGIGGALVVGCDVPSSREAVALARRYPHLRAAVGVHPHDSIDLDAEAVQVLRELAQQPEVVAFGEIGLDYHYDHSPRDVQRTAFRRQLDLADEFDLPIIIHEREAVDDVMNILDAGHGWARGGCWHCCSVTPDIGIEIAQRLYLGIAGWITFPKSDNIRALVHAVPLARLLVETDAPYIAPVPHRGQTNEPAYVVLTAQALAEIKGTTVLDVERNTSANTLRAFPRWGVVAGEER